MAEHHLNCDASESTSFAHLVKKPRLFYYSDACDAWVPANEKLENIIDIDWFDAEGEVINLRFKRIDMTDKEFEELPDL